MGVEKEILRPGTGPKPIPGHNVTVHCTGYGRNGDLSQKFWSTKDPGQKPFTFKIGEGSVIKGLDEGVMGMHLGEVARLQVNICFDLDNAYDYRKSALQILLMGLAGFQPGEYNQTPFWFSISNLLAYSEDLTGTFGMYESK